METFGLPTHRTKSEITPSKRLTQGDNSAQGDSCPVNLHYNTHSATKPHTVLSDTPLPTNYWTRPINGQNRLWSSISGSWLMASYSLQYKTAAGVSVGAFNPYSQAPQAPHVMWTKEITTGGLVGGDQETNSYYSGPSYTSLFSPPIVMDGKLYYNTLPRAAVTGFVGVDLRPGEQLWENTDGKRLVCGQEWNAQKYSYTISGNYAVFMDNFVGGI